MCSRTRDSRHSGGRETPTTPRCAGTNKTDPVGHDKECLRTLLLNGPESVATTAVEKAAFLLYGPPEHGRTAEERLRQGTTPRVPSIGANGVHFVPRAESVGHGWSLSQADTPAFKGLREGKD